MNKRRKIIIAALITLGIVAAIYLFLHFGHNAAPPPTTGGGGSSGGGSSTSGGSGSGSGTPPPQNTHRGTGWAETRGNGKHLGIEEREGEIP